MPSIIYAAMRISLLRFHNRHLRAFHVFRNFIHFVMDIQNSAKFDKPLLTLREAAALLGMSQWTLRRDVISRRLACVRRGRSRGKILILRDDLNAYIRRYRIAAIGE